MSVPVPAGELELELELACNDPFGYGESGQGLAMEFRLRRCELAVRDDALVGDVPRPRVPARARGRRRARPAPGSCSRTCTGTRSTARRLDELLARPSGAVHQISAIGHAHLDTAWLWPLEETYRKLVRTTTAQLRLLDDYPEHVFAHSQAQHYAWLRDRSPELYAKVREAVAAGRWIPVGGTWIEPDCNLPSGESLARQFLYGQRFFEAELGRRCTEFWNPDVFGYTAQLPQLMREAGITRFLTQKLSWNRFTQPEHHTFTWQGLDGSEVLTHFPPADTYNAEATVAELHREGATYKDHGRSHHSLMVFGHGDGGGGPTAEMLERLRRARDIAGPAEDHDPLARRVLRDARGRRERPADRRRRALLRAAPRHVHVAGRGQAAQPPRGGRAARGRAAGRAGRRRRIRARSSPRCGRRCCSTSSTTSCRAARSPRSTCAPARISPVWSRAPRRSRAPCWASRERPINLTPFARRAVVGDALYAVPAVRSGRAGRGRGHGRRAACWPTSTCGRRCRRTARC